MLVSCSEVYLEPLFMKTWGRAVVSLLRVVYRYLSTGPPPRMPSTCFVFTWLWSSIERQPGLPSLLPGRTRQQAITVMLTMCSSICFRVRILRWYIYSVFCTTELGINILWTRSQAIVRGDIYDMEWIRKWTKQQTVQTTTSYLTVPSN